MKGKTHASVGLALVAPLVVANPPTIGYIFATIIASFVPDWDMKVIKHRTWTHSILAVVVTTGPLTFINETLALFWFIGYVSHLILDSLTKMGVPFFYPFIKERFGVRIFRTGGVADVIINYIAIIILFYFIYCYVVNVSGVDILELLREVYVN